MTVKQVGTRAPASLPKPVEAPVVKPLEKVEAPQKPAKVDLGKLASGFVGIANEVVNAPSANEINQGPSQANRMAATNRAERIQAAGSATTTSAELSTQRFANALQKGAEGAWAEAKEPMMQATMGTLKQLASSEGSVVVKSAVNAAAAQRTVLPVAKVVGETFLGSMKTVLGEGAKATAKETGKAVAKETGKAVAKETGKAVAKEGVKAGVVGVGGSVPLIGHVINGGFALAAGADFVASLADKNVSVGESVGKFIKFGTSAVASFLPAFGGLLSFGGGVVGGAVEGAAGAHRKSAQQAEPPVDDKDHKLNTIMGEIRSSNALNEHGGTEMAPGTLDTPAQTAGVLNRLSTALMHGAKDDQTAGKALKTMADIMGTVTDASSLTAEQKKTLATLSQTVNRATDEGLKSLALKATAELSKPDVAKAWGKKATETAQSALTGIAGLQRMAQKNAAKPATPGKPPANAGAMLTTGLQVVGKVALTALEAKG